MQITKKFLVGFLTLLITFLFSSAYADSTQKIFSINVTQNKLQNTKDPTDFATVLYGLVLANEALANYHYELKMAEVFFTPDLLKQFKPVYEKDRQQNEVGCLDASIFTAAQDVMQSFWIGKTTVNDNKASVEVYLGLKDQMLDSHQPTVILHLINTPSSGWKIDDLIYPIDKYSLRSQLQGCLAHK